MPSWQRTLLVVCALPLGEVSCGVDRVTFLHYTLAEAELGGQAGSMLGDGWETRLRQRVRLLLLVVDLKLHAGGEISVRR